MSYKNKDRKDTHINVTGRQECTPNNKSSTRNYIIYIIQNNYNKNYLFSIKICKYHKLHFNTIYI